MDAEDERSSPKRRKLNPDHETRLNIDSGSLETFTQRISPPTSSKYARDEATANTDAVKALGETEPFQQPQFPISETVPNFIPSPIKLTKVEGLSYANNMDTVSLRDILGDPLIKQCWAFNYLIDVDYVMNCFDEDVRDTIDVTFVHGSWKREDSNKLRIEEAISRYKNVKAICAYLPDPFGTHHSKMIVLTRHDDYAQVIILTANFIEQDFKMCQAVWQSPLLPLAHNTNDKVTDRLSTSHGARFKFDFLSYLNSYGTKLKDLITTITKYDFSSVKAALIASTPSKQNPNQIDHSKVTSWGWPSVAQILKHVPVQTTKHSSIVAQVSSVATLGVDDKWLRRNLVRALSSHAPQNDIQESSFLSNPQFSIVFPTADTIRRSINGYESGGSIHMKTQSAQNIKQLKYIKPLLCHWASDSAKLESSLPSKNVLRDAGRNRAAPHIKTYLRFADQDKTKLDWAMMTSANLSRQAWGTDVDKSGDVKISSYEIGVIVWPELWKEDGKDVEMVPVFKKDLPEVSNEVQSYLKESSGDGQTKVMVGFRMPYDLPLVPYGDDEEPWCATKSDPKADWRGRIWLGY